VYETGINLMISTPNRLLPQEVSDEHWRDGIDSALTVGYLPFAFGLAALGLCVCGSRRARVLKIVAPAGASGDQPL
jgi:hypothetical protein